MENISPNISPMCLQKWNVINRALGHLCAHIG